MGKIMNIALGCFIVSIGVIMLKHSHIVTGGTAGLSLSLSYLLSIPFAILFFVINIPFYILSIFRMGWKFTLSTMFAVTTLSVLTGADRLLPDFSILPLVGAILGGTIIGLGLAILFLNGSSLGGANILALYLQKRFGWNPGKANFVFDFLVVMSGTYSVGLLKGLYSIVSIAIISVIISYFKGKIATKTVVIKPMKTHSVAS